MFWDKVSPLYDLFEKIYNGKVYSGTGAKVAEFIEPSDTVLECACGTGAISIYIAQRCRRLIATDFAAGMLRQAAKKCRKIENVVFRRADITHLKCKGGRLDKVVAGNVIHLLPNPEQAFLIDLSDEYDTTSYAAKLFISFLGMLYEDPRLSGLTPEQRKAVEISQYLQAHGIESEDDLKRLIAINEREKQKGQSINQGKSDANTMPSDNHRSENSYNEGDDVSPKHRKPQTYTPEPEDGEDSDEFTPKPVDYRKRINKRKI